MRMTTTTGRFQFAVLAMGFTVAALPPSAVGQTRAALVREMDSAIRGTRFFESQIVNIPLNAFSVTGTFNPVIPAGKKLYIQSISLHTLLTDNQSVMEARFSLNAGSGGTANVWIPQTFQAAATPQRHFTGNAEIGMVMNAGETATLFLFRNDNLGSSSLNFAKVTLIGYFVDTNP